MEIRNSELNDISKIFELYRHATDYMKSKNQVAWPEFEEEMIIQEINELRQWKLLINGEIACIWVTALSDELIWGDKNEPSLYIHRIATNPDFRGQNLVKYIVNWADDFCLDNKLKYVRMDTAGLNKGLIRHYGKLGFNFLGTKKLDPVEGLPSHYFIEPICLFQRVPTGRNMFNYNNKRFSLVQDSLNNKPSQKNTFEFQQDKNIISSEFSNNTIAKGHLLGLVDEKGNIEMSLHQINTKGEVSTKVSFSRPELLENGKIRLYEYWEMISGEKIKGESILEEI